MLIQYHRLNTTSKLFNFFNCFFNQQFLGSNKKETFTIYFRIKRKIAKQQHFEENMNLLNITW